MSAAAFFPLVVSMVLSLLGWQSDEKTTVAIVVLIVTVVWHIGVGIPKE